jgi:hypothetical protein
MTTARELMTLYVERTGVTGAGPSRRYLWTDAFAVCNLLGLGEASLATTLIDRVHRALGRHRSDDARRGWISGLSETDGEQHPTLGGLRIGKPLPERRSDERFDERLEWERDGQYFHYLTKWMHALDQAGRITADTRLATWARELADTSYRRFVHGSRIYWKMSIDLMRPLVPSMGQHDPLDGYVTCLQLRQTSERGPDLDRAIDDFRAMVAPDALATVDPLGIGGLLFDAYRLDQLDRPGARDRDRPLREAIAAAARVGLARYVAQRELARPAEHRLAFRELGLAIGLSAAESMKLPELTQFLRVREAIIAFWSDSAHRSSATYRDHQDINDVMLATSLAPAGFLVLGASLGR